jgi:DNA-binding FadR family transcriptional regulator
MSAQPDSRPRRSNLQPVRRQKLAELVTGQLEELLRSGTYRVGDKLPSEAELMGHLGVGRTTVREAIRVLAHAGMLDVRQGDGTYVRSAVPTLGELAGRLEKAHVLKVFAVRRALDLEMARLAATERSEADVRAIRQIAKRMAKILANDNSDRAAYAEASVEMHLAVAKATGNEIFEELYSSFAIALKQAFDEVNAIPGAMERSLAQHQALVEALADRDPDRAHEVTRQHLDRITAHLAELIETAEPPAGRSSRRAASKRS